MARQIRRQHAITVMGKPATVQGPGGMVEAGAMQKHDGRLGQIELPAAGSDEGIYSVDQQLHGSSLLRNTERLSDVIDDVGGGFDANRQPHQFLADARGFELGGIHLLMGCAGGMNDEGLGMPDIGQMAYPPKGLDEFLAGRPAALDSEADDGPRATR